MDWSAGIFCLLFEISMIYLNQDTFSFPGFIMERFDGHTSVEVSTSKELDDHASISCEVTPLIGDSQGRASVWKATLNIINFIEGVGFLALPFAVAKGGIAAIGAFFFMPLIYWFTARVLVDCLYQSDSFCGKKRVRSSWNEIGKAMWPRYGGTAIAAVQCFDLTVIATSYLIVCGSLTANAFPSLPPTAAVWTCIAALVVFPTTFLKSLSQIAWLSVVGIVALLGTAVMILWYGASHTSQWNAKALIFWDTDGFLISLGIIMFSYGSAPIVPSVEESMADKSKFGRALALAYIAAVLFKLTFSTFGFLSFSFATDEIVINNLPHSVPQIIVSVVFVLSCLFSYALPLHAVFQCIEESVFYLQLQSKLRLPRFVSFSMLRLFLVSLTLLAAVFVPHFGFLTSFFGNCSLPLFNCILPCVAHLILRKKELNWRQIALDYAMIVFGFVVSIYGTYVSSKALYKALNN